MPLSLSDYLYLQAYLTAEQWVSAVQSFTRPGDTTTYTAPTSTAAGDLIANSVTAGSVVPLSYTPPPITTGQYPARGKIAYVGLKNSAATSKSIRVHIVKGSSAPAVTNGDNGAILFTALASGAYLGFVDIALSPDATGGSWGQNDLVRIPYELASGESLYAYHEALTGFAPSNAGTFAEQIMVDRTK